MDCSLDPLTSSKLKERVGDACPSDSSSTTSTTMVPECAICLQSCIHPVCLPCCHVFCFLCVKGASWHNKRCALCRREIPEDFFERPVLLSPEELKAAAAGLSKGGGTVHRSNRDFAWYYEGRNGWWQYDERTSSELEEAFARGRKSTEMLIAGFLYVADLENMVQYRRNEHGRRRKIKRDAVDIPKKGVAGLRLDPEPAPVLPAVTPVETERISSADGSDSAGQSQSLSFGMLSLPPIRPPGILGHRLTNSFSSSLATLEESLSQLLVNQTEEEEEGAGDEEFRESEGGSEIESADESVSQRRRRPIRPSQPPRIPPRGRPSNPSLRSRNPDRQCTLTDV